MQPSTSIADLITLMGTLRDRDKGCPWDAAQDFASIAPYTIEEAYEVADAIERGDFDDLRDELGDLLFQVIFHARMAEEAGLFSFNDVVGAISAKMIRRHPHVFGDKATPGRKMEKGMWERIKAEEKTERMHRRGAMAGDDMPAHLDDVPRALPALKRAQKMQVRAAQVGFDWQDPVKILDKIEEEIGELREALSAGNAVAIGEEQGDLMFTLVNLARQLGLDAEATLSAASDKFKKRFNHLEKRLRSTDSTLEDATLETMESLWREAKETERDE